VCVCVGRKDHQRSLVDCSQQQRLLLAVLVVLTTPTKHPLARVLVRRTVHLLPTLDAKRSLRS
jgi:hypothetical protein